MTIAVTQGQKVFYLMEPTKVNLDLYNQWLRGDFGNDCFLPDEVRTAFGNELQDYY